MTETVAGKLRTGVETFDATGPGDPERERSPTVSPEMESSIDLSRSLIGSGTETDGAGVGRAGFGDSSDATDVAGRDEVRAAGGTTFDTCPINSSVSDDVVPDCSDSAEGAGVVSPEPEESASESRVLVFGPEAIVLLTTGDPGEVSGSRVGFADVVDLARSTVPVSC